MQPQTVEAVLVIAADAISASRPGSRGESLEHYIKRLETLEKIASEKPGVERVYALQAGREVRVMVKPTDIDDDAAVLLSLEIAREIEEQLEYPGQIKVTVIRESRAVEFAKWRRTGQGGGAPRLLFYGPRRSSLATCRSWSEAWSANSEFTCTGSYSMGNRSSRLLETRIWSRTCELPSKT